MVIAITIITVRQIRWLSQNPIILLEFLFSRDETNVSFANHFNERPELFRTNDMYTNVEPFADCHKSVYIVHILYSCEISDNKLLRRKAT